MQCIAVYIWYVGNGDCSNIDYYWTSETEPGRAGPLEYVADNII